jgi:hypothetical protein
MFVSLKLIRKEKENIKTNNLIEGIFIDRHWQRLERLLEVEGVSSEEQGARS